jgi:hypothetical protein
VRAMRAQAIILAGRLFSGTRARQT